MRTKYFGYFTSVNQSVPVYDPKNNVPCIVCEKPWEVENVCTVSLMKVGDSRSFFYRAHRKCYHSLTPEEQTKYDSEVIDSI